MQTKTSNSFSASQMVILYRAKRHVQCMGTEKISKRVYIYVYKSQFKIKYTPAIPLAVIEF